jgi:hypothetical protein
MPGFCRLTLPGAACGVRGGTIFAGQLAVHDSLVPVFLHVSAVRVGQRFVQLCCPVVGVGRVKAHHRSTPDSLQRPHIRHHCRCSRLRDVIRSRASRPALLEVGRPEAGRQLGIPFVQIADSRVKFNRSSRPAGRKLPRPVSASHLLVVSQSSVFHKGRRRLTGPRHVGGRGERDAGRVRLEWGWHARQTQHAAMRTPGHLPRLGTRAGRAKAAGWFVNRSHRIAP